jgi:predicted MFS family arabinose efflux permease
MIDRSMSRQLSERRLVFVLGAVQFVNVLDFMMVAPLGPYFATGLDIPGSRLGLVVGAYTAAAAVTGIAGAFFLERFDRRRALLVCLLGLGLGTLSAALAQGLGTLLVARVIAGAFGGPATSLCYSIIADAVPPERRGRAVGAIMASFSVASVVGLPMGLKAAELAGWRSPFLGVGTLIVATTIAAAAILPPLRAHLERGPLPRDLSFMLKPLPLLALLMAFVMFTGNFLIIPNIAAYIVFNLGFDQTHFGSLYMVGGVAMFLSMRVAGVLVDRSGATLVAVGGTVVFGLAVVTGYVTEPAMLPVPAFFLLFMASAGFRMVPMSSVATRVPGPTERARYMSVQSAVQHLSASTGAGIASLMLVERSDKSLGGMPTVAWSALALAALMPVVLAQVEARVRRAERAGVVDAAASPTGDA